MTYKPDKKVKIKGMRKIKHLSKTQVDVLVESYGARMSLSSGVNEFYLAHKNGFTFFLGTQTVRALIKRGMLGIDDKQLYRTKSADEYLMKYHRDKIKHLI